MFALVDCNNFYASCERVFRPDLVGQPIVVLSNNDGCVIARSNEAKAIGVPMGAPAFENERLFQRNHVRVFSANFPLYGDMSHRVMQILRSYCPDMEIYSIDEAFLKPEGFDRIDLYEYMRKMYRQVQQWTGIPISIGMAPTKALAKVANKIAKKFPEQTGGIYWIDSDMKREKALRWMRVEDVWGIGRKHAKRLKEMNISTAFDFIQLSDVWIRKYMAVVGLRLKRELQGISMLNLDDVQPKKMIATTRTFETNYCEWDQISERISTFAVSCSEKLRQQHSCCNALMVFIVTNWNRKDLPQYARNIVMPLPYSTNSSIELAKFANFALSKIFKKGYFYKKAGVIVLDLSPEETLQTTLFEMRDNRHTPLMQAVDNMNSRYGQQKIRLAAQDQQRIWKMKQEKLSPQYTTRLSDVIKIHC